MCNARCIISSRIFIYIYPLLWKRFFQIFERLKISRMCKNSCTFQNTTGLSDNFFNNTVKPCDRKPEEPIKWLGWIPLTPGSIARFRHGTLSKVKLNPNFQVFFNRNWAKKRLWEKKKSHLQSSFWSIWSREDNIFIIKSLLSSKACNISAFVWLKPQINRFL